MGSLFFPISVFFFNLKTSLEKTARFKSQFSMPDPHDSSDIFLVLEDQTTNTKHRKTPNATRVPERTKNGTAVLCSLYCLAPTPTPPPAPPPRVPRTTIPCYYTYPACSARRRQDPVRVLEPELALQARLSDAKRDVRRCLCDDFDTPGAVTALQELVKAVNKVKDSNFGRGWGGGRWCSLVLSFFVRL